MEEKERYINLCDRQIKDTQDNSQAFMGISSVCKRLNKQSNRIKELAEENQQLKQQLEEKNKEIKKLSLYSEKLYKLQARIGLEERTVGDVVEELDKLRNQLELLQKENQQLKQSQNQKAIEELEKLKSAILSERNTTYFKFDNFNKGKDTAYYWANEIIDNQIKSLKGEKQ